MGIHRVAVGVLASCLNPSEFLAAGRCSEHGRIDVEPQAMLMTDVADLFERIERPGSSRSDRRTDEEGTEACCQIRLDRLAKRLGTHGECLIDIDQSEVPSADADDARCLLDTGMGLCGRIGDECSMTRSTLGGRYATGRPIPGRDHGADPRRTGRVLDDTATCSRRQESIAQTQEFRHPIEHPRFDFGARWTGGPQHALHTKPTGDEIGQNRWTGGVRRKVGKPVGRLPVGDTGHHDPIEIGHDAAECLT